MGRETAFLQRLANLERRRVIAPTTEEDLEALMESVRANLTRLLNARWGMSEALPEYGLPSLVDITVGTGDPVRVVEKHIKDTIDAYEPRLRSVRVSRIVPDEGDAAGMLSFRIAGQLRTRTSGDQGVWYETELTQKGDFGVLG